MSVHVCAVSDSAACQRRPLRAARANRVFRADEKRIRTENTVIDKYKNSTRDSNKIAECARAASRPRTLDDPRGQLFVRAIS
jgi:hypothetical protein